MDSAVMVEKYGAQLEGQQLLWRDDNITLRNTPFKPVEPEFDRQALIHWWMHVYVPDGRGDENTPYEVFKTWSNSVYGLFQYVSVNGYVPDTMQSAVQFVADRDAPIVDQVAELRLWLPHIRPWIYDKSEFQPRLVRFVKVFEHTLSEHGSYHLLFDPETEESWLEKTTWGHARTVKNFPTLEEMVGYVASHHWYSRRED
jgi:hypothetical protein